MNDSVTFRNSYQSAKKVSDWLSKKGYVNEAIRRDGDTDRYQIHVKQLGATFTAPCELEVGDGWIHEKELVGGLVGDTKATVELKNPTWDGTLEGYNLIVGILSARNPYTFAVANDLSWMSISGHTTMGRPWCCTLYPGSEYWIDEPTGMIMTNLLPVVAAANHTLQIPHTWDGTDEQYLLIDKWLKGLGQYETRLNDDQKRIEITGRSTKGRHWAAFVYSGMRFWLSEDGVICTEPTNLTPNPIQWWDGKSEDPVNHPSHYTDGKIEVADFIADKNLNFFLGNVVKYICRAGKKDPEKLVEDLEKAQWYLAREIQRQKGDKKDVAEQVEKLYDNAVNAMRGYIPDES